MESETLSTGQIVPSLEALQPVEVVHRNAWFALKNRGGYFSLEYHMDQVVVLPIVDSWQMLFVRVRRPLVSDTPLELPAGASLDGEAPRATAQRELAEETGIMIDDTDRFIECEPLSELPGRSPQLLKIYRLDLSAREFRARVAHDNEVTGVELLDFEELRQAIVDGRLYVSSCIAIAARYLFENAEREV